MEETGISRTRIEGSADRRASVLQPVKTLFQTVTPEVWPHVFPLHSMPHHHLLRGGQSVNVIKTEILEDILRRRFRRGARQFSNPSVHVSDSHTIEAFREACESLSHEKNSIYLDNRTRSFLQYGSTNRVLHIINQLYELANVLTISEIVAILKETLFEDQSISDTEVANLLISRSFVN
jgi:hypothetical protein